MKLVFVFLILVLINVALAKNDTSKFNNIVVLSLITNLVTGVSKY